ncbi:hypothetical protein AGLY_007936 [Aphis glycines]|uniref:Uncharacterized protein n=1 Tax=Aphis glycines TaxID=307491 RepID=A0A6G0TM68_APHGL|nr:hypothetical protein AGLY_007936 [Aphis glycines]
MSVDHSISTVQQNSSSKLFFEIIGSSEILITSAFWICTSGEVVELDTIFIGASTSHSLTSEEFSSALTVKPTSIEVDSVIMTGSSFILHLILDFGIGFELSFLPIHQQYYLTGGPCNELFKSTSQPVLGSIILIMVFFRTGREAPKICMGIVEGCSGTCCIGCVLRAISIGGFCGLSGRLVIRSGLVGGQLSTCCGLNGLCVATGILNNFMFKQT